MAEIIPDIETFASIKVVGVGGAGNNAINRMIQSKIDGIEFIAVNTDAQALHYSKATKKLHIGKETTKGLGAGADPEVGKLAAEESLLELETALKGSEMVIITLGEGGGTGSGAAPVVAQVAKDLGALTVAIATKPFSFEGDRRRKVADSGLSELKNYVDTLIVIPNDRIITMTDNRTSLIDAFAEVDEVLRQGIQGISDLITQNGLINLDFADIKSIMSNAGSAIMAIGISSGDNRATEAMRQAMESPLLDENVSGATGVLINFTGGRDMSIHEVSEAAKLVHDEVDPEASIIWGTVLDEAMTGEMKVTLVATGFDVNKKNGMITPSSSMPSGGNDTRRQSYLESISKDREGYYADKSSEPVVENEFESYPKARYESEKISRPPEIKVERPVLSEEKSAEVREVYRPSSVDGDLLSKETEINPIIDEDDTLLSSNHDTDMPSIGDDDNSFDDLDKPAYLRNNDGFTKKKL